MVAFFDNIVQMVKEIQWSGLVGVKCWRMGNCPLKYQWIIIFERKVHLV
jgi:hypothetical protein